MKEETKMLLKLILAEEEESEAGQNNLNKRKHIRETLAKEAEENKLKYPHRPETAADFRKVDMERARTEMYESHEAVKVEPKDVPIWAKYALTLPEAASYFHLGYSKLREIVRKDKYAEYLLWNGGRVYIKRKLFEEYLNKETEV